MDVLLAEGDYLEPDLVVVLDRSAHLLSDRGQKLARYRTCGVPEYRVVDPEGRTVAGELTPTARR